MMTRLVLVLAMLAAVAAGYGGFERGGSFPDFTGEAERLSELNREWQGQGLFRPSPALVWLGGHGGGNAGPVTIGGRGALAFRHKAADAVEVEFLAVQAALDLGWQYKPVDWLALRPGFELGGAGWGYYVHDRDGPFNDPNFSRWYAAWTVGIAPAFEVMGRVAGDEERYTGLFVKAGYCFPLYGPQWYADANPPGLGLKGPYVQLGLRFGRVPPTHLRI